MEGADIHDRCNAEQEVANALAMNKAVIECSPFCTIVTDSKGRITVANAAASKMLLYSTEELVGESPITLLHDPDEIAQAARDLATEPGREVIPDHLVFRVLLERDPVVSREWTYIRKDGTRLPVQLSVTALKHRHGATIAAIAICSHLT